MTISVTFTFETFVVIATTLCTVVGNSLILLILLWTDAFKNINRFFFCSMTVADLLVGLIITPFAIVSSLYQRWVYNDEKFCHMQAYASALFWIASLYSMMWINVDHYFALRKPERYITLMSHVRSGCWIALLWVAAVSFCMPPLFTLQRAKYYEPCYICVVDAHSQRAYFITAGLLITVPPMLTIIATNAYLFTESYRKMKTCYQTFLPDKASRAENYQINAVSSFIFAITWMPWCIVQTMDGLHHSHLPPQLHFYSLWLALGNSFYKFFVYLLWSREMHRGLRTMFCQQILGQCWNGPRLDGPARILTAPKRGV